MSILPLLPILILLGGALAIVLAHMARQSRHDAIASIASLLALAAMLPAVAPSFQVVEIRLSAWQPLSVFGAPVSLRIDRLDWLIGFVAIIACAATALAGLAYPGQRRFAPRALALGMTAALVAAAFSANLLTLAIAWGLFDALFAVAVLARGETASAVRRAAFAVAFNSAATVCLWVAALALNQSSQSQYWHLTRLSDAARDWLTLAAVLRLGLYPLSQWLPAERDDAPGRVALLYVLPPLAGLHVLIRLASLDALPPESTLAWLAAISLLVGGVLAWWRSDSRDALPYIALSSLGAVVLSGQSSRATTDVDAVLASGAASWVLAIMTLSLGRSFDRQRPWWAIGHALAFATLAGVPASLGFAVRTSLAAGVVAGGDLFLIIITALGESLVLGAVIRLASAPAKNEAPAGRWAISTYTAAMGLVALPPFLLPAIGRFSIPALAPPSFQVVLTNLGVAGSAFLALPIGLAASATWLAREQSIAPRFDPARWLSLDWLYSLAFRLIGLVARLLSGPAMLLEGDGAMLWALLILIAAYIVFSGAIQ